ncbi:hypothetical protein B0T21DRAFT_336883 [Apiosordaria backusii]|uniref:Uncharacterized protein n=1 Tax=Apiosordaria backusii TaxID=314023 RepID=A0AA40B2Z1_9PEZI|nr:hypothetical protein B0T21DRAFT_336883 [Apiosordaria backusii]
MAVLTALQRKVLGDLTTTFTPPPSCQTPAAVSNFNIVWRGQTCAPTAMQDNPDCWPPRTAGAPKANSAFYGWGFYSPGLECPQGYTSACTASATSQGWRVQFKMEPEETFVGCCPDGYVCHNQNGQTCIANARTTAIETYHCDSGTTINLATMTLPAENWSQAYIYAPMIQLAWKISDLPSDRRPSPTAGSEESSGGGMSTGAIAGVAVGAAAVVIAIVVGAFLLWRMKRRGAATPDPNIEYSSVGKGSPPPGYATPGTDDQMKQMNHYYAGQPGTNAAQQWNPAMKEPQATPYELGYSNAPVELSGARWDIHGRVEAPGPEIAPRELGSSHGNPPVGKPGTFQ